MNDTLTLDLLNFDILILICKEIARTKYNLEIEYLYNNIIKISQTNKFFNSLCNSETILNIFKIKSNVLLSIGPTININHLNNSKYPNRLWKVRENLDLTQVDIRDILGIDRENFYIDCQPLFFENFDFAKMKYSIFCIEKYITNFKIIQFRTLVPLPLVRSYNTEANNLSNIWSSIKTLCKKNNWTKPIRFNCGENNTTISQVTPIKDLVVFPIFNSPKFLILGVNLKKKLIKVKGPINGENSWIVEFEIPLGMIKETEPDCKETISEFGRITQTLIIP